MQINQINKFDDEDSNNDGDDWDWNDDGEDSNNN